MRGLPRRWYIAGGWALDLFLGRVTREHDDVEVAVLRRDQRDLWRHFRGWELEKVVAGKGEPWREDEWLSLPVHEIHGRDPTGGLPAMEILLNETEGDVWRFRRNLAVMKPLAELGLHSPDGIPFLAPEVVLLYKAKDPRPRDEQDFRRARPALGARRRQWLRGALETAHLGHPWLAEL